MSGKHFMGYPFLWIAMVCMFLGACTDLTDVENDIKTLQGKVTKLEDAVSALQAAYEEGKVIKSVDALTGGEETGWTITFLDDTSITLLDGKAGVDGDALISSVTEDAQTGTVTLVMADGTTFNFNLDVVYPTGIVLLTDELSVGRAGVASFEFRVNPSNAVLDMDVEGGTSQIALDWVGNAASRSDAVSYVTPPVNFKLLRVEPSVNENGEVKAGQYRAYVQDLDLSKEYSDRVTLVISTGDGAGNNIQLSSAMFTITVRNFDLPVVYIDTPEQAEIVSKDDWVKDATMRIENTGNGGAYSKVSVKGRGNSTWGFPKKPYAIKLDKKAQVLGMPKHKRWVLLANWMDRTLLRNSVAFEIAKKTGLEWTPKGQFVEVVLNGKHIGNYYLCEQIKIDENRLNIAEMEATDISGETITGGYLLELDVNYDEANKFRSDYGQASDGVTGMPVNIKAPDEDVLQTEQFDYIKNYFNAAEAALYAGDFASAGEYEAYIDVNTFIDWWFVHELAQNGEPGHPKSSYMYKDRDRDGTDGKLKAGPVWDFDWGTFVPGAADFYIKNAIWYGRLFQIPGFVTSVKERWASFKNEFDKIPDFIDSQATLIKNSEEINSRLWPISSTVNGDESLSFEEAVERMKEAYKERVAWLDDAINNL